MQETAESRGTVLKVLAVALGLAVIHQYLFYGNRYGLSIPLFTVLFYAYMLVFAKDRLRPMNTVCAVWTACVLLLVLTFGLFANEIFYMLNQVAAPALIVLHLTYILGDSRPDWGRPAALLSGAFNHLIPQNLRQLAGLRQWFERKERQEGANAPVLARVLLGLTISVPLLAIVLVLLSSADGVFHAVLTHIPDVLARISLGEGIARTLWALLLGAFFFGYLRGFVHPFRETEELPPQKTEPEYRDTVPDFRIDSVVAVTVLTAVNTVYVLFVSVQFSYLFGAWQGLLPSGDTYAEYARRGFFELVLVSGINFVLLLGILLLGMKGSEVLNRAVRVLLYVLTVCSGAMLVSAFIRLAMYEEAYGYTTIRFLVHGFMIFLGALLAAAALRIAIPRFPLVKCYLVLGLAAYLIMNYTRMDAVIASNNIARYEANGQLDTAYLLSLSDEAVPMLVDFSAKHNGMLDSGLRNLWQSGKQQKKDWTALNWSRHRAETKLDAYFEGRESGSGR
ncbi:DUF4173 domain-containing protein [Paenibacillus sp. HN-1]|uniref:DUF4153 domain-containing protein n=1 Tax=Paenibacillus TaxID=44249 RepID=UPI001CA9E409|nr:MULTISPECIES: DUF4173 domain-containing protein [Paenibacillus]MBY9079688.1 DUF4173 domain-containing protein [Paenibacillus sp. CGMCC 1.18879]MBY9082939.1 DUF4173 domain-containing protein [Paenibacillus sinensis]